MARIIRHQLGFFHADNATIVGDVVIGQDANFWFGSVVRADVARIEIGARVNIQDGVIIHADSGNSVTIEDDVSIGHGAVIHGQRIGQGTLVGMGARILGRTIIGRECIIGGGAVVPPGMVVPDGSVVLGVPGSVSRAVNDKDLQHMRWIPGHYVQLAWRWTRDEFPSLT